jgi:putative protease
VFLGEVKRVLRDGVVVPLEAPLKLGDGVVFDAGHPEGKEEGGRIYEIRRPKSEGRSPSSEIRDAEIRFGQGDIDFSRIRAGDRLWKTNDPELDKRLRRSFAGDIPRFQRPVEMEVHGLAGKPLTLILRDESGHVARATSAMPLARAEKLPLTEEKLREQLGRLGGTPFTLGALNNFLSGEVLLPVSELNRLRREAVDELEKLRLAPQRWTLHAGGSRGDEAQASTSSQSLMNPKNGLSMNNVRPHPGPLPRGEGETGSASRQNLALSVQEFNAGTLRGNLTSVASKPELIALVRNLAQLEAALKCGVTTVYCEFEDPKKYREAVTLYHTARGCSAPSSILNPPSSPGIFVAPPRIFKPGDDWILKQVRSCNADGYLVRNYDHLQFFADARRVGDFSLNVANRVAAGHFMHEFGLERLTASYDLNVTQLDALLQAAPPAWFEITIHQHMPMFHMEHCVFCAFLSAGKDYRDCGRPCDRHDVRLRDRVGAEHPLKADAGCRNTVFNSQAQTGAEFVARLLALGVRHFRVEFLNETPEEVARTVAKYRELLRGEISGTQLWRELKLFNQLGVTRGQMGK